MDSKSVCPKGNNFVGCLCCTLAFLMNGCQRNVAFPDREKRQSGIHIPNQPCEDYVVGWGLPSVVQIRTKNNNREKRLRKRKK